MTNEQAAQTLEAMARDDRETAKTCRSYGVAVELRSEAEALEAGAACLRREAAYHERLIKAIGAVPHESHLSDEFRGR